MPPPTKFKSSLSAKRARRKRERPWSTFAPGCACYIPRLNGDCERIVRRAQAPKGFSRRCYARIRRASMSAMRRLNSAALVGCLIT